MKNGFYISTDKSKLDIDFIHDYLANHAYWAKGRSRERVIKSIENSMCFGVFDQQNKQLAFARLVTDFVVFAWLMDLFVATKYSGQGIGKMLVGHIVGLPEMQKVNGIGLRTNDAHGLYEKYGFEKIDRPETWMLKKKSNTE